MSGGVDAPVEDGGRVVGGVEAVLVGGVAEDGDRINTGGGDLEEVRAEGGPGGFAGEPQDDLVGLPVQARDGRWAEVLLGGDAEPVDVLRDGRGEQLCRVVGLAPITAGGLGVLVVFEDAFEDFLGGANGEGVVVDGVGLAVAGDDQVEVVGVPSAAGGGVELLAGSRRR